MNRWPTSIRVLVLFAVAALVGACEPLSQGDNSGSNCQLAITDSSGTGLVLSGTSEGAQSFIPTSSNPFLTVALQLNTVSTSNPLSNLTGTLTVQIEQDLNSTSTIPTQPQCLPNASCGLAVGTIDLSMIAINQPVFYTITLNTAVNPIVGSPLWVVVYVTYGAGGQTNIVWGGSSSQVYSQGPALVQAGASWSTTPLSGNLDVQIGCQ